MNIRLPLAAAFTLAALLSMVNVHAYKRGAPSQTFGSVTVVSQNDTSGALQLGAGSGNGANQVSFQAGVMNINFARSGASSYALQPTRTAGTAPNTVTVAGDDLHMLGVFTVTNNDVTNCQDVFITVTGTKPANLAAIYGRYPADSTDGTKFWDTAGNSGATLKLGAKGSTNTSLVADFWWKATTASSGDSFTVTVSARKSATCP